MTLKIQINLKKLMLGCLICLAGGGIAAVLLLEKSHSSALLGIGVPLHLSVLIGVVCMAPGAAMILDALPPPMSAERLENQPSRLTRAVHIVLFSTAAAALACLLYLSFGAPPDSKDSKRVQSRDISKPLTDLFHEGEIVASVGFFLSEPKPDFPLLIHGPGRNLLPAWIATRTGATNTMVAKMRFVTAAGSFLAVLLCSATALATTMILLAKQSVVRLSSTEVLGYALVATAFTMAIVALFGTMTNRELVRMTVYLISVNLIWAAASERFRLTMALSFGLGFITMLSPLHTYLAAVQSVLLAFAAAGIALVMLPGKHVTVFFWGVLGAGVAFWLTHLSGTYGLIEDAVSTTLYWSRVGGEIWELPAPKQVLIATMYLILVGAGLLALAFTRSFSGFTDKTVRGLSAFLAVIIVVSTMSYSNRSDPAHFDFALFSVSPALAALCAILLVAFRYRTPAGALVLAIVLTCLSATNAIVIEGSNIQRALQQIDTPDEEILPPSLYDFQEAYGPLLQQQDCLLVLSNEGALAYLSQLPPCGPMFYPIYASADTDLDLAAWLRENPQKMIVAGSESNWSQIDGRPMRERLPQTYEVIDQEYPVSKKFGIWELRFSSPRS